jgi:hypothetical protein
MISVILSLISIAYADPIADPESYVRELHKDIRDIRFEYSGSSSDIVRSTMQLTQTHSFSGSLIYRNDRSLKLDSIDHITVPETGQKYRNRIIMSYFGDVERQYNEQGGPGGLKIGEKGMSPALDYTGSATTLFSLPEMQLTAKYPKKSMIHEGTQEIDGHPCEIVSFLLGPGYDQNVVTDKLIVIRYFLDMKRGAMPIRFENWRNGEMTERTIDIVLEKFEAEDKKSIWLPISARHEFLTVASDREQFPDRKLGTPFSVETFEIRKESIRINSGIKDDRFVLRYPDGAMITEKSVESRRNARNKATQPPPIDRKVAQDQLEAKLKEGEETRSEIIATSTARRDGSNLWTFAFSGLGVVSILTVLLLKFRGHA